MHIYKCGAVECSKPSDGREPSISLLGSAVAMPLSSSSSGHPHRGLFASSASDERSNDLLLCGEDASCLSDDERLLPVLFSPGAKRPAGLDEDVGEEDDDDEVAAAWVGAEADHFPEIGYRSRFRPRSGNLDPAARLRSVAWILKVAEFYQFQPVTAYLAVNYMDRFLSRHALPQPGGWPVQLLAVACLSLAAKMEETVVPSLLDLQVEGARFVFEPRTIQRMELLVLDAVNWRLRSVTPFAFLGFFVCKADPGRSLTGYLVSRATRIILATTQEIEFLGHCPSAVAAAAIACAAREAPALSSVSPEGAASWCAGLTGEGIVNCYQLMQELVVGGGDDRHKQQHRSRTPPQLQRMKPQLSSEVVASSLSSHPSPSSKRRKLSSCSRVDDGKGAGSRAEEGDDIN